MERIVTDTTTTVIIRVLMSILSTASPRGKLGYKIDEKYQIQYIKEISSIRQHGSDHHLGRHTLITNKAAQQCNVK